MSQLKVYLVKIYLLKAEVVAVLLLFCFPALADSSFQDSDRLARKACLTGDYSNGVSILADMFISTKNPMYIYNQGRCFEQNRRYEDAIARFEEYLRLADLPGSILTSEDKAFAKKHITDCKAILLEQQGTKTALTDSQAASPTASSPISESAPFSKTTTSNTTLPGSQPIPSSENKGLLTAGIITASVGAAFVGAGVLANFRANQITHEMNTEIGSYSEQKENKSKSYNKLAWAGYGLGAACIATGAILVALGLRSRNGDHVSTVLLPVLIGNQMGVSLTGVF